MEKDFRYFYKVLYFLPRLGLVKYIGFLKTIKGFVTPFNSFEKKKNKWIEINTRRTKEKLD